MRLASLCAASFAFLSLVGCGPLPKPSAEQVANDNKFGTETEARIAAEDVIKRFLKHPLDASFSWGASARLSEPYGTDGRRNWIVAGTVQAPNDFGANLTKPYQATLCVVGGKWECVVAFLDGKPVYQNGALVEASVAGMMQPKPAAAASSAAVAPAIPKADPAEAIRKSLEAAREGKPLYASRTWSIRSKPVVGKLKSFGGGKVKLETADGETLDLTPADLSPADLKFVNENLR